jgi:copper(I)-binding protein
MRTTKITALLGAATLALALTACGSDPDAEASDASAGTSSGTTAGTSAEQPAEADALGMEDPWVKAATEGMTAAFGTLTNDGDADITVVSAESGITDVMELHETVQGDDGSMAMQPKEGGFTVPAGGRHELAPGGDHLMVMDLGRPLQPGETVTITLTLADGTTTDVECTVKSFTGADEKYQDDGETDMGHDMEMGSEEDSSGEG